MSASSAISRLVRHVATRVPYYRERYGHAQDIAELPPLDRATIQRHATEMLADDAEPRQRQAAVELLRGETDVVPPDLLLERTSGTTGLPLRFVHTRAEGIATALGLWGARRTYDPAVTPQSMCLFRHADARSAPPRDPYDYTEQNIVALYREIDRRQIGWIHCTPDALARHLAILATAWPAHPQRWPRFIETTGHHLPAALVARTRAYFGAEIANQYGCMEVSAIGYARAENGFQILDRNVVVEILDEAGTPIHAPGVSGRVAVTQLHRRLMPFCRYLNGDLASWRDDSDGNRLLWLEPDREANLLHTRVGEISGNAVFRRLLVKCYAEIGYPAIGFLQIEQTAESKFVVAMNDIPEKARFQEALERTCTRSKYFRRPITIELNVLPAPEVARRQAGKPGLFFRRISLPSRPLVPLPA